MSDSSDDKMPIKYVLIGDSTTLKIITEFSTGNPTQKTKKCQTYQMIKSL